MLKHHSALCSLLFAWGACSVDEGPLPPKPANTAIDVTITDDASTPSTDGASTPSTDDASTPSAADASTPSAADASILTAADAAAPSDASIRTDAGAKDGGVTARACNGHAALCARRYNEVAYPSTHNGHAARAYGYSIINANQQSGLDKQLDDGVRGFLLDVYEYDGRHVLCHGPCKLGNTPHADWLATLKAFLDAQRREVVTIIYQDGLAAEDIAQDFSDAGLDSYVYTHTVGKAWPTLAQMIAANKRLVVTAEFGRPPPAWFHHVWDEAWDTPYEFRNVSDFNCKLNRGDQDNPLFLVNHWLSGGFGSVYLPSESGAKKANAYEVLYARLKKCRADTGQIPNFVAVDFYEHGDLFKAVDALNGL
jgi:hypothetical protein